MKKGFQLSITMMVTIILGVTMLGVGIGIFNQAFQKTAELRDEVDANTQTQLNRLLDDGSLIVIPFNNKEGVRGEFVDFDIAIANEQSDTKEFTIHITYAGSSAYDGGVNDPLLCIGLDNPRPLQSRDITSCGTDWTLVGDTQFTILSNERKYVPIRIEIPKKVRDGGDLVGLKKGQYLFNVDVCIGDTIGGSECSFNSEGQVEPDLNRHHTRQKLTITI